MALDQALERSKPGRLGRVATWLLLLTALALAVFLFRNGIVQMVVQWQQPEYSHGYFLPFVVLLMALQRSDTLREVPFRASWFGALTVAVAVLAYAIGELSTLYAILQYALLLALIGLLLTVIGIRAASRLWAPILFLAFLVPLPNFLYFNLSAVLQLISSQIGVAVIRSMGIAVFLQGNVIDLGSYKLQVAEACSGLRYLFPLMSFGYLWAFLYRCRAWVSLTLFLSTIPTAILMNSLRIAMIGLLVEHQGIKAAKGFLHLFEGWVVFLICLLALLGETIILHRLTGRSEPLRDALAFRIPAIPAGTWTLPKVANVWPLASATVLLLLAAIASASMGARPEVAPPRSSFSNFPLILGGWHGRESNLDPEVVAVLKLTDYFNANYTSDGNAEPINLYIAYYSSQRKGASAHSPRSCIPGDGWEIENLTTIDVTLGVAGNGSHPVNRVIISKGSTRQLVYYWFQQRGRIITNEYMVKWSILTDSITRNRTDGALVRLVTPMEPGTDPMVADMTLQAFMRAISLDLNRFVPD